MSLLCSYGITPYVSFFISSKNVVVCQDLASVLIQSLLALVSPLPAVSELMRGRFLQDLRITKVFNLRVSGSRNSNSTM